MVTENGVVDGKERLLAWKDNGKGGAAPDKAYQRAPAEMLVSAKAPPYHCANLE